MSATYRQIPGHLSRLEPFKGNSLYGEAVTPTQYNGHCIYRVTSYATCIAWVYADGRIELDERKYSRTTSRQQTVIRAYLTPDAVSRFLLGCAGVPQEWIGAFVAA